VDSNTLTISTASPNTISNITYIENSLVLSAGQDHDSAPQTPTKNGNVWTITLNADRNGTSDVAQSFNTNVGGASHEYASSEWGGLGNSPSDLNFYFGVNLSIGTETITVYLGQGHWGAAHNNWWFGSSALIFESFVIPANGEQSAQLSFSPQIVIDGTQFCLQGKGDSSFNLATWPPNS
jgi:hypothetical protein